jgi:hypothetical protein
MVSLISYSQKCSTLCTTKLFTCCNPDEDVNDEYISGTKKGKPVPVTGCGCPQGCEMVRLPHFLDDRLTVSPQIVFSVSVYLCPLNVYECNILLFSFRFIRRVCTSEPKGSIHDWVLWQIRVLGTLPRPQSRHSICRTNILSIIIIPLSFLYTSQMYMQYAEHDVITWQQYTMCWVFVHNYCSVWEPPSLCNTGASS